MTGGNEMLSGIQTLAIKPLKIYSGNKTRHTTLTNFGDVFNQASQTGVGEVDASAGLASLAAKSAGIEKANSGASDTSSSPSVSDTSSVDTEKKTADTFIFRDPVSGKEVVYEDVAKKNSTDKTTDASTDKSVSVNNKDVKTASSMKKTKFDAYFKKAAVKYNVSESLLKAIAMAESNFNPNCTSSSGAMGVMQLMPETARGLGVTNAYDPEQNIMGGAKCIAAKLKEFNGNVKLALAAYNAGSGAVRRYGGIPSQCKKYVQRVLSFKKGFETAKAVG